VKANRPSASRAANRRSILPRFYRGKFILSPALPVRSCHPVGKTSKVARRGKYLSLRNGCASRGIQTTSSSCPAISARASSPRKRLSALCTLQPLPPPPRPGVVVRGSRRPIAGAIPPLAGRQREKRKERHPDRYTHRSRGGGGGRGGEADRHRPRELNPGYPHDEVKVTRGPLALCPNA